MLPIVVIPARLASTRLPEKPLAKLCGQPMIVHVLQRAVAAGVGRVIVATDDETTRAVVVAAGGEAVMTRSDHASGSDRVLEALGKTDPTGRHPVVVNLQGDLPTVSPLAIRAAVAALRDPAVALGTVAAPLHDDEIPLPQVVKLHGRPHLGGIGGHLDAIDFTRTGEARDDGTSMYHHVGIYAWRRSALAQFASMPPSPRERIEALEQLRALEAGMRIGAMTVSEAPFGVDTPADLERARTALAAAPMAA